MSEVEIPREADQITGVPLPEWSTLVGHAIVRERIGQALSGPRPPTALLLAGPRGIGKATLAFTIARELITRTGDEPPERVAAQIAAMSHPNLFVLRRPRDAASSANRFFSAIRVEDVRATREALQRTRGRAGYRVCIIDCVDDCNASSANALLKTLEEPPDTTLFLVISHRPGGLLPTIRSRCQIHTLRPIAYEDVHAVLARSGLAEDSEAIERATALAQGRPRRGFEALVLAEGAVLDALATWLEAPGNHAIRTQLGLADALASAQGAELALAQDMVRDWIAAEARAAATDPGLRRRLASANELWDKALALFADADIYNLDRRQTLVSVFDAIRGHRLATSAPPHQEPH